MHQIRDTLGVGTIHIYENLGKAVYRVSSTKDLMNVIIPHFNAYPLISQKQADFELFKKVVDLINRKEHLTMEGLNKILGIRAAMNKGLSEVQIASFPDITAAVRPVVQVPTSVDPDWLAGFTSGEGCFYVQLSQTKKKTGFGVNLNLRYIIGLGRRDTALLHAIMNSLGCGNIDIKSTGNMACFTISSLAQLNGVLIPLFDKHPILGIKQLDYIDFCKISKLAGEKAHLTKDGLEEIRKLKLGMNSGRIALDGEASRPI